MSAIPEAFHQAVCSVLQSSNRPVALHEPFFDKQDIACVVETIESGWVSYQGSMVHRFEQALASYLEMPHVMLVVNGTTGLFITLKVLNIGHFDEVLIPSLTFAATANAIVHAGAIPHFVDSCQKSFAIDFDKLENYLEENTFFDKSDRLINKKTGNQIKAIVPVHILGASFDIARLKEVACKFKLKIIEDSAEAFGSKYGSQRISALTGIGVMSFNGNKIITTGGGGAVVVQDEALAQKIRHITTTAKKPHRYELEHDDIGYNLRLPALNAALGYSQMMKMNVFLSKKRALYNRYLDIFKNISFGKMFNPDSFGESNCWLNAFILNEENKSKKDSILDLLNDKGIAARPFWKPLHLSTMYQNNPRSDCSMAMDLYERVLCLPSSASLADNV